VAAPAADLGIGPSEKPKETNWLWAVGPSLFFGEMSAYGTKRTNSIAAAMSANDP
jgi:hypothetical protein